MKKRVVGVLRVDFRVERYARTYSVAGKVQEGAWGILVIPPDGSPQMAAAACPTLRARPDPEVNQGYAHLSCPFVPS